MTLPTALESLFLIVILFPLSLFFLDSGIQFVADMSVTVLNKLEGGASTELHFKLLGYFCAGDEPLNYGEKMADYLSKGLGRGLWSSWSPTMPSWLVRPDKTPLAVAQGESGKVLMPVEVSLSDIEATRFETHIGICHTQVTLSWKRNAKDLALSADERLANDMSKFDVLFEELAMLLKFRNLQNVVGMEKSTLLCWFVWDLHRPWLAKLSRYAHTPLYELWNAAYSG